MYVFLSTSAKRFSDLFLCYAFKDHKKDGKNDKVKKSGYNNKEFIQMNVERVLLLLLFPCFHGIKRTFYHKHIEKGLEEKSKIKK